MSTESQNNFIKNLVYSPIIVKYNFNPTFIPAFSDYDVLSDAINMIFLFKCEEDNNNKKKKKVFFSHFLNNIKLSSNNSKYFPLYVKNLFYHTNNDIKSPNLLIKRTPVSLISKTLHTMIFDYIRYLTNTF